MFSSEAPVLASVHNRVGHLVLNRPAGLNALTLPMVQIIHQHLQAWAGDEEIVAVVLRATGEKAFCAGGDIRMLYDSFHNGDGELWTFFEQEYQLDLYIHSYPKPLVALMHGYVLGGGMGLVQGAVRVVSESARLGMPEVGIGYFPDVGASHFLPRLPGSLGIYMGVTGKHVDAANALYAGLADHCLPRERFDEFLQRLAEQTWDAPASDCLARLIAGMALETLPDASFKALAPAIEEHFAHDSIPAIRASLAGELRPEYQDWACETLQLIDSRSPLAVSVTLELLRRGRERSLAECFAMELHLDRLWFERGDILEGIRALIVDKDNNPRWNPPSLDQVSPRQIEDFFRGL